ncbi:LysR family transcriptional regulator [Microbulbifer sp. SAOS-129_SWC]|uniref:LysR family transcriptional regulator n=1 Tax=Microbulbifer sp. SAOS-129_SWC TaxID=3145235 RepID=UPI003216CBC1
MQIDDWNQVHCALAVARAGTLSGAAQELGVSHSTVLRRVDSLEKTLNARLFYRHPRGYVPTEAGRLLMRAAQSMQEQLNLLVGRVCSGRQPLSGALTVCVGEELVAPMLPLLQRFQRRHQGLSLRLAGSVGECRGVAVGLCAGARPSAAGLAVQSLPRLPYSLYGARSYLRKYGALRGLDQFGGHRFISCADCAAHPALEWMEQSVPKRQLALRCGSAGQMLEAVRAGIGIAPLSVWRARAEEGLCRLLPPPAEWQRDLWLYSPRDACGNSAVRVFSAFVIDCIARLQRVHSIDEARAVAAVAGEEK